jgi:hypothetical protein
MPVIIRREESRGQTIPFYVIAVIMSLALSLFVMNYTNTIRWHIRAQNAADAVALAMVSGDANVANQIAQEQYAATIAEYRVRSIMYSMVNAANGVGTSPQQTDFCGDNHQCKNPTSPTITNTCDPSDATGGVGDDNGVACDDAYDQEPAQYDNAVQQYANAVAALVALQSNQTVPGPTKYFGAGPSPAPGPTAPPGSAAAAAFSYIVSQSSCWNPENGGKGAFDCAFNYNDDLSLSSPPWFNAGGKNEVVVVTACRTVTSVAPRFISTTFFKPSFSAVASSAATLQAVPETGFKPGDATVDPDPNNPGNPYAPPENYPPVAGSCLSPVTPQNDKCNGWMATQAYTVDYTPLQVNLTFYRPALTRPPDAPTPICQAG